MPKCFFKQRTQCSHLCPWAPEHYLFNCWLIYFSYIWSQKRSQMLSTKYNLGLCKKVTIWSKRLPKQPKRDKLNLKKNLRKKVHENKCHSIFMWCSTGVKHDALSSALVFGNFVFRNENWVFSVFNIHEWLLHLKKVMWHNWLSFSEPSTSITYHS